MTSRSTHVVFGAGPLGLETARQLARTGARVRLATRSLSAKLADVEHLRADLTDPASAVAAANGAEALYFCAAPPYHVWPQSFPALQEGAIAAAKHSGAVLVAAENLYGYGVAGDLTEALPLAAKTRKGSVRARMSRRLFEAHASGEIRAVSGRASDFFGPGVRQSAFGERFWPDLLRGKPIGWFGDPDKRHSVTYLPDFARALITLGASPDVWGRAWHAPSPEARSPRELAQRAARIAGTAPARLRRTPRVLLQLLGLAVPAAGETVEMEYAFVNDFVMRQDDWNARFDQRATDGDTALEQTLEAWRAQAGESRTPAPLARRPS